MALVVKNLPAKAGDTRVTGSIHGSERSPGVGNGTPLQYSPGKLHGQKNLAGYGSEGHKELDTTKQLSTHTQDCVSYAHSHAKGYDLPKRHRFVPDL